jgi:hypothetical protein
MKRLLLTLALLWPVGAVADLAAGARAFLSGDYATAMREWRPLAKQGLAIAQLNLGIMYGNGEGVVTLAPVTARHQCKSCQRLP